MPCRLGGPLERGWVGAPVGAAAGPKQPQERTCFITVWMWWGWQLGRELALEREFTVLTDPKRRGHAAPWPHLGKPQGGSGGGGSRETG